jgi:hypothetical protein
MGSIQNTNGNDPFELFPFRHFWIASAVASGYGYHGWLNLDLLRACAFRRLIFNPSPSDFAFYSITLRLSLRFSLRSTFPDGVFHRIQCGSSLAISTSAAWNITGFSAFLFPGIVEETCVSSFSRSLTQPSNERLALFSGWMGWKISLFVQTLTLLLRKPEGLNDTVPCSIKCLSADSTTSE